MTEAIIYKVVCNKTNNVYYGSTKKTLANRLSAHKYQYQKYLKGKRKYKDTISIILEQNDYTASVVETFTYNDYKECLLREGHYIDTYDCVNKVRPSRTRKQWRAEHKEHQRSYMIEYMKDEKNKQRKKEMDRLYYDKIKATLLEKVVCECGASVIRNGLSRHKKTKKHLDKVLELKI